MMVRNTKDEGFPLRDRHSNEKRIDGGKAGLMLLQYLREGPYKNKNKGSRAVAWLNLCTLLTMQKAVVTTESFRSSAAVSEYHLGSRCMSLMT